MRYPENSYVDGFVVPVQKARLEDYKAMAERAGKIWLEHGALAFHECVADDAPVGEVTSFPRSVQLKDDEIVVFSWIVYENREQRDAIMKKVMADTRIADDMKNPPFEGRRMIYGGFKTLVEL